MRIIVFVLNILFFAILTSCEKEATNKNEENFGNENWPGKNGAVKTDIEITDQFISAYDMSLRDGSTETYLRFKVALNENDTIKQGYLHLKIFHTIEITQLSLIEYLDVITVLPKLPRLTNEGFKAGDVAFGQVFDGKLKMCFTRNNVFVIIHAPLNDAISIAQSIDHQIQNAPEWNTNMGEPSFNLKR